MRIEFTNNGEPKCKDMFIDFYPVGSALERASGEGTF